MFGLKYGTRPAEEVIQELGEYVLPHFPTNTYMKEVEYR